MTNDEPPAGGQMPAPRPASASVILTLSGPVERDGIAAICERARTSIERTDAGTVICDVGRLGRPDAVAVETLARLQLEARRLGRRMVFRDACGELRDLVAFVGLDRALPCEP